MRRILLDTQAYLWFVTEDPRLTGLPLDAVRTAATAFLSVASLWEIGIKHGLRKLDVGLSMPTLLDEMPRTKRFTILPIESRHILRVTQLPHHHRDPFDRMIVAQALEEGLAVVGSDGGSTPTGSSGSSEPCGRGVRAPEGVECGSTVTPLLAALLLQRPEWGPPPPVAPYGMTPLPAPRVVVPMIFPVVASCRWRDSYGARRVGYLHTGIDIQAPKMSPIVAPFGGKIGFKRETFWIYGDSGWTVLGTHLNDDDPGRHDHRGSKDLMFAPDLVPGSRVMAGQLIGYVGQSGDATGPHLHFELYAPGAGPTMGRIRDPFPSLKFSQRLSAPVPRFFAGRPPKGTMRLEGCIRRADPKTGLVTLILVSKQLPNGRTVRVSHPRYVRLRVSPSVIGYDALTEVPETRPFGVLIPAAGAYDGARVSRVILPAS